MIKKLSFLYVIAFFFFSCSTMNQHDLIYSTSRKSDNIQTLAEIEKAIVTGYIQVNSIELEKIKKQLDELLKQASSDSGYLARIYALYADYYLLKRDKSSAKKMIKKANYYDSYDEYTQLINSRLISKNEERELYLKNILNSNPNAYRLKAELGSVYYQTENYTDALVAFDGSLDFLPEEYSKLYGEKREYCKRVYRVDADVRDSSSEILARDKIKLVDMTSLTQDSTHALDFITGTNKWEPLMLAERLRAAGWYLNGLDLKIDLAKRKDAALFLWHLIAEGNSEMLSKYSRRYADRGNKSPIPDVAIDGVFFDAILGVVEEDIIPLVDGKNFAPDGLVNGLEFYNWLKEANKLR